MALSVIDHGGKEGVRQGDDVAKTILAFGRLNLLLKSFETILNNPLSPRLSMLGAKSLGDLVKHTEVLSRLGTSIDHFAEASDLEALDWVFWEQFPLARIALFEEFADSHRLGQSHGFLDDILVLNDQRWDELHRNRAS